MKAILLAAGYGTRLRPITNTIPKCLVPINGKPLLQMWLERLTDFGVSSFLINTHYFNEKVEEFLQKSEFKNNVETCYEENLLGTAGTLIQNIDFYEGGDGLLVHADNYCMANFNDFFARHFSRPKKCMMTMMTFFTENPESCGIVELDSKGVVEGFHEKVLSPPGNIANGAIYVMSKEILGDIKLRYDCASDFSNDILPAYVGKIYTYHTDQTFADIGTVESYKKIIDSVK
jgi:mannose-1-phosphate guanylyltransferase